MLTKTRVIPVSGIGARLIPTYFAGASPSEETPALFPFDLTQATFLAATAKRNSAGPFAAGVLAQGNWAGAAGSNGDMISYSLGNIVAGTGFYQTIDQGQGTAAFWITPEWNGNDGKNHYWFSDDTGLRFQIYKNSANRLSIYMRPASDIVMSSPFIDVSAWTAGTTYCVVVRWDYFNTIDGSNYCCISVNDAHTFGQTTAGIAALWGFGSTFNIGWDNNTDYYGDAIIEGFTIYRRVLYDGTYGVNVGNGDEINLIYSAGAGADPCTITGSWDVTLCICTDSQVGALVTG